MVGCFWPLGLTIHLCVRPDANTPLSLPCCCYAVRFEIRKPESFLLCLSLTIVLFFAAILSPLHFRLNFSLSLSIYAKKAAGLFMGMVSNLWVYLGRTAKLSLLMHKYAISSHRFRTSLISFNMVLFKKCFKVRTHLP